MRTVVALITQERWTRFKQRRDVGTVWRMAIGAIFGRRLMFPQEGSALFGMAGVASFSDRIFLEQFGTGRTMRVVAIGTDHLAFLNWVVRIFGALRPLLLVAGKADLGLGLPVTHIVVLGVECVARCTR